MGVSRNVPKRLTFGRQVDNLEAKVRRPFKLVISSSLALGLALFFLPTKTEAGFTSIFPSTGLDASGASGANLNATDSARLASINSQLITTSDWPDDAYDENKYIQFDFEENFVFGAGAGLTDVRITLFYRSSNTNLAQAKLKVYEYDTETWHEEAIGVPGTANVDEAFSTGNISSYIDTATDLNNLSVRYLAYDRSTTTTSFNQVSADITYTGTVTNTSVAASGDVLPAAGSHSAIILGVLGLALMALGIHWWQKPNFLPDRVWFRR